LSLYFNNNNLYFFIIDSHFSDNSSQEIKFFESLMRLYRLGENWFNIDLVELENNLDNFWSNCENKNSIKNLCEILGYFLG
jgi:hypothetical protein